MNKVKYLILGAGPAGLCFAKKLEQLGERDFLILEKEAEAGGLCRSVNVDGSPLDIGGGHFLDVRRPLVNEFLFQFMPKEEWNLFERDSRIHINDNYISHPFEANIWQLNLKEQVEYLKSIAVAGCNLNEPIPTKFIEWIHWKLGDKIAEDYMIPYNSKMFADDLNELGTYWLEKLPNVSFEETLLSCLTHQAYGTQPGHAQFYYPKRYGYGEVWSRIAASMRSHIMYNSSVEMLDIKDKRVITENGEEYVAQKIITTVPWKSFKIIRGMPQEMLRGIQILKHNSIQVRYVSEILNTKAHWIYEPDLKLSYHRILVRHNFCPNSKGYWQETRKERIDNERAEGYSYMNEYAYPLNTVEKPQIMKSILVFCKNENVYGLGRWGEHSHYNSDLTVEKALNLAEYLFWKK